VPIISPLIAAEDGGTSQGQGATLCTLHIQVFDEGSHLAALTDRDMVGDMDQQIAARTAADQKKAAHGGNARGERRAQANMIHCIGLISIPTRRAQTFHILIIEMAHHTAIRLDLVHRVNGTANLNHFSGAIGGPQEIKRHVRARGSQGGCGTDRDE